MGSPRSIFVAALLAIALAASCRGDATEAGDGDQVFDASPRRHLFAPPPGEVRAVPPHAIRSAGVGPYLLGATLEQILGILPHGPRVELLQIQNILDYSLVRIEGDALIIGVERFEGVTFLAVLAPKIARTEQGVGVGTEAQELREALGPHAAAPTVIRDPRVLSFATLPNTHFVLEDDRVIAVIVRGGRAPDELRADSEVSASPCDDAGRFEGADADEVAEAAGLAAGARDAVQRAPACFGDARAQLLVTGGEQIAVVGGEPGDLRGRATIDLPGLVYAAPLDVTGDGRHEIAAVASRSQGTDLEIEISILELRDRELSIADRHVAYRLSPRWATWVGAKLANIELLIELEAGDGALAIGGLYVDRDGRETRHIAPMQPRTWAPAIAPAAAPDVEAPGDEDGGLPAVVESDGEASTDAGSAPPREDAAASSPPR